MVSSTSTVLVLTPAFLLPILLFIAIVYYKNIILQYQQLSLWKVRRPTLFLLWLIMTICTDWISCLLRSLLHLNIISYIIYNLSTTVLSYYGGITFGSIRIWLLYYDLRASRSEKQMLLCCNLKATANPNVHTAAAQNTFSVDAGKKRKLGSYKFVTFLLLLIVTPICIVTLLAEVIGYVVTDKLIILCYAFVVIIFNGYCLFSILCKCHCNCCCYHKRKMMEKFRDDWSLLLELTLLWISWLIGLFAGSVITILSQTKYINPFIWLNWTLLITRCTIISVSLIIPYRITKKLTTQVKTTDLQTILQNVLSKKSYFFTFVEHLVHEFSVENLTFLVAVWQYKYQEKCVQKETKMQIDIESSKKSNNIPHEIFEWSDFFSELPWSDLPLAESISFNLNNKWNQSQSIFSKFLDIDSYDAVNLSSAARDEIISKFMLLKQHKKQSNSELLTLPTIRKWHSNPTPNYNFISHPKFVMTHSLQIASNSPGMCRKSLIEMHGTKEIIRKQQFNKQLTTVFDAALDDIFQNLIDSLNRFICTEQYKLAQ